MKQVSVDPEPDVGRSRILRGAGLAGEAYELILEQLISVKIPPGARITVDELARQFGISQTPIREALGRLETHGLVIKTHLIGYRAAPQYTREQFNNLYEVRLLLEPAAVRRTAEKIEPEELGALQQLIVEMQEEITAGTPVKYGRFALHDAAFHACIAAASKNDLIAETLSRLHSHVHIFRHFFNSWVTENALLEHRAIVEAIVARDAALAEQQMRTHIEASWQRLERGF